MIYLIAMIPALGWGFMPIITTKVGGSPVNQMFGLAAGASVIGVITYLIFRPAITAPQFWFTFAIGIFWSTAQVGQFVSFKRMGVSSTIPMSTAFQLIGSCVLGILFFGNWPGSRQKIIGLIALVVVMIGVLMTSVSDDVEESRITPKNVLYLLVTTAGYLAYSTFPNMAIVKSVSPTALLLPETLGILTGATIYAFLKDPHSFRQREQYLNITSGLAWGIAGLTYIFAGQGLGVSTAQLFTTVGCIYGTYGGIYILHEKKSRREYTWITFGSILIVLASAVTGFIAQLAVLL